MLRNIFHNHRNNITLFTRKIYFFNRLLLITCDMTMTNEQSDKDEAFLYNRKQSIKNECNYEK